MDYTVAQFVVSIVQFVSVVAVGLYSWWVQRQKATQEQITRTDDRLDIALLRVERIETAASLAPKNADIGRLYKELRNVQTGNAKIEGQLQQLVRQVSLMDQALREREK